MNQYPPLNNVCRHWIVLFAVSFSFVSNFQLSSADSKLVDDRRITITSVPEIEARRRALIAFLWGQDGFPTRQFPSVVRTNIPSPVKQLTDLTRVDEFLFDLAPNLQGLAYHFIPSKPNGALAVVHHGHGCTLDDDPSSNDAGYGLQRTIKALLGEGYGVLGVFMPHMRPGDCTGGHEQMFSLKTTGSPMKYFFEPIAFSLNYLASQGSVDRFPAYREFHMIGLSGGGWTTTVYSAIDPRIRCSISVAGTIPLYLRSGGSVGDREQFDTSFYSIAGYPDLYILGSQGAGRGQVQLLNRKDDCCFGEAQHDATSAGRPYAEAMHEFERDVSAAVSHLGQGTFRIEIDETAPSHMISHHAIRDIALPEFKRHRSGSKEASPAQK